MCVSTEASALPQNLLQEKNQIEGKSAFLRSCLSNRNEESKTGNSAQKTVHWNTTCKVRKVLREKKYDEFTWYGPEDFKRFKKETHVAAKIARSALKVNILGSTLAAADDPVATRGLEHFMSKKSLREKHNRRCEAWSVVMKEQFKQERSGQDSLNWESIAQKYRCISRESQQQAHQLAMT